MPDVFLPLYLYLLRGQPKSESGVVIDGRLFHGDGFGAGEILLEVVQSVSVGVARGERIVVRLARGMAKILPRPAIGNGVGIGIDARGVGGGDNWVKLRLPGVLRKAQGVGRLSARMEEKANADWAGETRCGVGKGPGED